MSAKWRAPRVLVPYVAYVPMYLTYPTCPRALLALRALRALRTLRVHVPKYILHTRNLKISVCMKSNVGSFTDVFKGAKF